MNIERLQYYESAFGKEDSLLKKIRKHAQKQGIEYMQLSPPDARILQFLTQAVQAKKAVEIGGLYGYSAVHIARGLSAKGLLFSLDIDSHRQNQAQKLIQNQPEFKKIKWITGDAHQTLKSLSPKGPFDLVFIDADKAGYMDYLLWAEKNLKIGGIVSADNAFLFHTLYAKEPALSKLRKTHGVSPKAEKVLKQFNKRLMRSPLWKGAMIPTEDGLMTACRVSSAK